jgi:hypothetical protein
LKKLLLASLFALFSIPAAAQVIPQPSAGGGAVSLSGTFTFTSTGAKPTCNSTLVASGIPTWTTRGVLGAGDTIEVCRKYIDNTYGWDTFVPSSFRFNGGDIEAAPGTTANFRLRGLRGTTLANIFSYEGSSGNLSINNGFGAFLTLFGSPIMPTSDRGQTLGHASFRWKSILTSYHATTLGTCTSGNVNEIAVIEGSGATPGSAHICLYNGAGGYSWKQIAIGS